MFKTLKAILSYILGVILPLWYICGSCAAKYNLAEKYAPETYLKVNETATDLYVKELRRQGRHEDADEAVQRWTTEERPKLIEGVENSGQDQ